MESTDLHKPPPEILHNWIIHPTSLCRFSSLALQPSYVSILQKVPNTEGDYTWLCSHRGTGGTGTASPMPTASGCAPTPACHQGHQHSRTQAAGSGTPGFICIIIRDIAWLYGAGCVAQGGLGKPPGTPQDVASGVLSAAPSESLNSLGWEGPSADHPVPTPSKGRDTFHKTFQ